jgi:hypothetical protein
MSHRLRRKTTGFLDRRRQLTKAGLRGAGQANPRGFAVGSFRTGVSAETMKTTSINTRSVVTAISGSSQRGAWDYQRKPAFYQVATLGKKAIAPKGQSFRDILERELGSGKVSGQVVQSAGADAETTQVLAGFWGVA